MDIMQTINDLNEKYSQATKYAGMDTADYPGDEVMEALINNTNLYWTGFYLTPAPSQGHKLGWMEKYEVLKNQGWGFAPIYVGQQQTSIAHASHKLTTEQGTTDGKHAATLAGQAKIPKGSVIYLDFENGPPSSANQKKYFVAWCNGLQSAGYTPGVYCLFGIAADLLTAYPNAWVWGVHYKYARKTYSSPFPTPDPTGCGYSGASLWQLVGNTFIQYKANNGTTQKAWVDLNSADMGDPSRPV